MAESIIEPEPMLPPDIVSPIFWLVDLVPSGCIVEALCERSGKREEMSQGATKDGGEEKINVPALVRAL